MPLITTIVPCFKQAHYLPVTLASVQSQTLADWECLIIDDGSPDATGSVAKSWVGSDQRFRYFRKENGGLSSARNFGLTHARGQFIQFLDSDDAILPNKFQRQIQQLAHCPSHSLSFCDYERGSEDNIFTPPAPPAPCLPPVLGEVTSVYELAADWETRLCIPAHCFLFNRVFFDEGITFDESLANHEDWDCWMRIFANAAAITYCPEKMAIYRRCAGSLSRENKQTMDGYLQALDKHLSAQSTSREIKAVLRAKRAEIELIYERHMQKPQKITRMASALRTLIKLIHP